MLTVAVPKRNKLPNIIVLTPKDGVVSTCEIRLPKRYVEGRAVTYLLFAMAGEFLLYNPYLLF